MSISFTLQWYCEVEQQDIGYRDLFKVVRYHCSVTDITITAVWSKTETKIEPHRFHWFKCIPVYLGPDFFSCRIAPQESNKQIQNNWHLQTESSKFQFLFSCLAITEELEIMSGFILFITEFSTQVIESAIYKIHLYISSMYEKTYIWHQFLDEGDHSCHVMEDLHMLLFHPLDGESIIVLLLLNNSNLKHKAGHIISSSWYLSANQIQDKSCTSELFSYLMIKVV